jgi:hypothetical protein
MMSTSGKRARFALWKTFVGRQGGASAAQGHKASAHLKYFSCSCILDSRERYHYSGSGPPFVPSQIFLHRWSFL